MHDPNIDMDNTYTHDQAGLVRGRAYIKPSGNFYNINLHLIHLEEPFSNMTYIDVSDQRISSLIA
jgi:hypothetical protein